MIKSKELKEFVNHGSSLFPLCIYDLNFVVANILTPYHWHNEIEIIYVESGSINVSINSKTKRLNEGDIIFINSEDLHQISGIGNISAKYYALVFSPELLSFNINDHTQISYIKPLLNKTLKLPQSVSFNPDYSIKIIKLVKDILGEYYNQEIGWYLNIKICLYKMLSIFARENLFIEVDSELKNISYKEDMIKKVLSYIHSNYDKKIYINDLASYIGLNSQYFCRLFKSVIGKTPIEYINRYRINMANEYLQENDLSITDVCFKVGFENHSYFIKLFKKYNNMTPIEYKKIFLYSNIVNKNLHT